MDKELVVGRRTLGLHFREELTIRNEGLLHHNQFVNWAKVQHIRITHFAESRGPEHGPLDTIKWDKMVIQTVSWKLVLDSRVTVYPDDDMKYALGAALVKIDTTKRIYANINPAFVNATKLLEKFCPNKIIHKTAFWGSFDFSEWTSWVGAILVLSLIGFMIGLMLYAAKPLLFRSY